MVLGLAPWWMGQTERTSFLTQGVQETLMALLDGHLETLGMTPPSHACLSQNLT
jgi:hypothetical protein